MNFEETTVNIILNEMFTEGRKTLSQSEFDEITKKYAKRIVKLFAIPGVSNNEVAVRSCDNCKNNGNKGICIDCNDWCNYERTDC